MNFSHCTQRVVCFALVLSFFVCNVGVSQSSTTRLNESSIQLQDAQRVDSSSIDESTLSFSPDSPAANPTFKQTSGIGILIRMILVLAVVIFCVYAVLRFMRSGLTQASDNDPFLRRVASLSLSPGKSIQIVTLLENAYIIGVTDNAVNLIGQVQDKELVDAMNLYADKHTKNDKPRTFNDILSLFMNNSQSGTTVFGDSAKNASELIKRQRDRLRSHGEE
ncbi:MAG: flagellar biosynthetic protein FliO [Treponema sp.]|nr:flagellar biosynthetic protein FliO [Treponema sp.]